LVRKEARFRAERFHLTRGDVLARLAMMGTADLTDAFMVDDVGRLVVRPFGDMPDELRASLASIKVQRNGATQVQVADKRAALMDFAKLQGWLVDQSQWLGADGQPIAPGGQTFILQIERDPVATLDAAPASVEASPARPSASVELDKRLRALR
jgi:hypothetical protein